MLDDQVAAGIAVVFIAIIIVLPFAFHVKDSLARGTLNTSPLQRSTWAAVVFGFCLATLASYKPENHDALTGSLYALVFYVGVIGVFVLPFLLLIIASYLFGYLFWSMSGRKRNLRTDDASGKMVARRPSNTFGKRNRIPE
jgi:hypothetical protein